MSLQKTKDLWKPVWSEFAHPDDLDVMANIIHGESAGIQYRDNRRSSARDLGQQMGRMWEDRCGVDEWGQPLPPGQGNIYGFGRLANIFDARVQAYTFCRLAYDYGGYSHWGACYDYQTGRFTDLYEYPAAVYRKGPNPSHSVPRFTSDAGSWLENNPYSRPLHPTVVSKGERNWRGDGRVSQIQRALGIGADGIFGNNTETEVMAYQRSNGLVVDGYVGPATAESLGITIEPSVLLTPDDPYPPIDPPDPPTTPPERDLLERVEALEDHVAVLQRQADNNTQRSRVNRQKIEEHHPGTFG